MFNPHNRRKIICASFPQFTLAGCELQFVDSFRYLGHIIDNSLCDNKDIQRCLRATTSALNHFSVMQNTVVLLPCYLNWVYPALALCCIIVDSVSIAICWFVTIYS